MTPDVFQNSVLKYLLAQTPHQSGEELLSYFSEKRQRDIQHGMDIPQLPLKGTADPRTWLSLIHPDWILKVLESEPSLYTSYFSILPPSIKKVIDPTNEREEMVLSPIANSFFAIQLQNKLLGSFSFSVPDCLPSHSLRKLALLSPFLFEKYCHITGFLDLAVELKLIINPHLLRQIDRHFSKFEKQCLLQFSKKSNLLKFAPLKLNHWNGKVEDLFQVLYFRGLNRVAKGLYDAPPEFTWYIEKKIPPRQTSLFHSLKKTSYQQKIHQVLIEQLIECLDITLSHFHEEDLS